jgi:hypothetical protein
MCNPLRTLQVFCILLLIGVAAGCGSDDPVAPVQPPVLTSAGTIGVYGNPDGSMGKIVDSDGIMTVYVVHNVEDGVTASSFRIQAPAGWTRVGAQAQYPVTIGDVDQGISIAYGSCTSGSIHVMTLTYASLPTPPASATFRVLPGDNTANAIQVTDCDYNVIVGGRGLETQLELVVAAEHTNSGTERDRPTE